MTFLKEIIRGEFRNLLVNIKKQVFIKLTKTRKSINFTLVTVSGYNVNSYSEIIHSDITV